MDLQIGKEMSALRVAEIAATIGHFAAVLAEIESGKGSGQSQQTQRRLFHVLSNVVDVFETEDWALLTPNQSKCEDALSSLLSAKKLELTMPFRKLIADLYCTLFCRGERRHLFSTLANLQEQIGPKGSLIQQGRITSIVVLGQLSLALGSQISSYLQDTVKVLSGTYLKANDTLLREVCVVALVQVLSESGSATLETHQHASKVFLRGIVDKAPEVRMQSADAIISLAEESDFFSKIALEPLLSAACKAMDDECIGCRAAFARVVGCLMAVSVEGQQLGRSPATGRDRTISTDDGSDPNRKSGTLMKQSSLANLTNITRKKTTKVVSFGLQSGLMFLKTQ